MNQDQARFNMVEQQIRTWEVLDKAVLNALMHIKREDFVPADCQEMAYADTEIPLPHGQTMLPPRIDARLANDLALTGQESVLEIGTGSAYQTALLAELAAQVFSIERFPALLDKARPLLQQANVRNVSLLLGDGTLGWREYGPYDGIVVSAGAPHVPPALEEQLAEGGRMLIPIGDRDEQILTLFVKRNGQLEGRDIVPVRFVPLIGAGGWLA